MRSGLKVWWNVKMKDRPGREHYYAGASPYDVQRGTNVGPIDEADRSCCRKCTIRREAKHVFSTGLGLHACQWDIDYTPGSVTELGSITVLVNKLRVDAFSLARGLGIWMPTRKAMASYADRECPKVCENIICSVNPDGFAFCCRFPKL